MQIRLPFDRVSEPLPQPAMEIVRVRRARRYILRVRPDGTLRITVPRGGSRAEALRFADRHRRWIEQERARVQVEGTPVIWRHGTSILLRGTLQTLQVSPDGTAVAYGDRVVAIDNASNLRLVVEADLRALAQTELVPRLHELARVHQIPFERVIIRNQRSRWGSCSPSGVIALNFRLVQMPPDVCDYVLVHELMHRRQQDHSRRFWRLIEAACPEFRDAERWLKMHGRSLF